MTSANKINDKLDTILKLRADIKKMLNELDPSTELVNPDTGDKMLRDDAIKVAEDVINKVENDINEITNNGQNVKNIFNNAVEIIAEGSREELSKFTGWLQMGPPNATIEKISIEWSDQPEKQFSSFEIH